jgi:predicted nucleic acid-binding protein
MSDRYFVDTNVLVYAHDSSAGIKHERAKALLEELWREIIADYLTWTVVTNSGESILEALEFETRYRVSFWDALVLQAANAAGADLVYSEDLSDGQVYGNVRVVNPLADSATV